MMFDADLLPGCRIGRDLSALKLLSGNLVKYIFYIWEKPAVFVYYCCIILKFFWLP